MMLTTRVSDLELGFFPCFPSLLKEKIDEPAAGVILVLCGVNFSDTPEVCN